MSERKRQEELRESKDMLDSMYGNFGGKVFDLNNDLNISSLDDQSMVMFQA